ncbi:MAG TPA: pseudouridine synthase, partial [Coxiellaceae bacterium]|nr:pseudouridine synthase [Coxiellaceae bacterium]
MTAQHIVIDRTASDQRIDNFLIKTMKGVPHSRLYKAIRKGEVRVNKGRVQASYRLKIGDIVRLPPLRVADRDMRKPSASLRACLQKSILFENDDVMILNKPAGLSVHGGSEVPCGLIDALRDMYPNLDLALAHRLDRDTSGCLLIAKNRSALLAFQAAQKNQAIEKTYFLLVKGAWTRGRQHVKLALLKNELKSGERMVVVDAEAGKPAETIFEPVEIREKVTCLRAQLVTGRTHQIRVHAQA